MIWCTHFCPLGYLFEISFFKGKKLNQKINRERRRFLIGLTIGIPGAILFNKTALPKNDTLDWPVLPPGAKDQNSFSSICSRCYACVNVCPTKVIKIKFPFKKKLSQFFQPELDTSESYCDEFCNACTRVCPSGAILPISLQKKKERQIGIAVINRKACLAWEDGQYCMVCDEFCPYHAIEVSLDKNQLPKPIVKPEICRGCGSCEQACPAIRMGKAIIVHGIEKQKQILLKTQLYLDKNLKK
jgi:ferredoxin